MGEDPATIDPGATGPGAWAGLVERAALVSGPGWTTALGLRLLLRQGPESVTLLKNENGLLPLGRDVLVCCSAAVGSERSRGRS